MTVLLSGAEIPTLQIDLLTQETYATVTVVTTREQGDKADLGDPVVINDRDGGPVLAGEVVSIQPSRRHWRLRCVPSLILDLDRSMVGPVTLYDVTLPDAVKTALGEPNDYIVAPRLRDEPVRLWTTRERTTRWAFVSLLRLLAHNTEPVEWRYDARNDRAVVAPHDDMITGREMIDIEDVLVARGGGVEVSAARYRVQAGDVVNGKEVLRCAVRWSHDRKRSILWTAPA